MGRDESGSKSKNVINFGWFVFIVWFCSNLLSQLAYIIAYGLPYDGISMLKSLGPVYYVAIFIEVMMWLFLGGFIGKKLLNKINPVPMTPA
ncbi:MAG: hypothetical protein ISR22_02985 [Candidatus Poseidoniaceae archaeon]|nr:hypothetical protein [Candidatus Poseidoniaceae archaeon]